MNEVNKLGTKIIARTLELLAESEFSIERISTTVDLTHDRTSISVSIVVDGRKFSALHYIREGHVDEEEFIRVHSIGIVRELENRVVLHRRIEPVVNPETKMLMAVTEIVRQLSLEHPTWTEMITSTNFEHNVSSPRMLVSIAVLEESSRWELSYVYNIANINTMSIEQIVQSFLSNMKRVS